MAREAGTTPEAVELYLEVIDLVYTGAGGGMFHDGHDMRFFKYVPAAFRALGILHRRTLRPDTYDEARFFGAPDAAYAQAADRALAEIGGTAGLRY